MTQFTRNEVESAIEVLTSSYTYDPPERWHSAFERLVTVRLYLAEVQRSFRWIGLLGVLVGVGSGVALFAMLPTLADGPVSLYLALLATMLIAPEMLWSLSRRLAERREPLVKLNHKVNAALAKFSAPASALNEEQYNVPT